MVRLNLPDALYCYLSRQQSHVDMGACHVTLPLPIQVSRTCLFVRMSCIRREALIPSRTLYAVRIAAEFRSDEILSSVRAVQQVSIPSQRLA